MFHAYLSLVMVVFSTLMFIPSSALNVQAEESASVFGEEYVSSPDISVGDSIGLTSTPRAEFVSNSALPTGVSTKAIGASRDGIVYDDGTVENAWGSVTSGMIYYGHRFAPGPYPYRFTQVSSWLTRTGSDSEMTYYVEIYDNDGTGGAPSTYLGTWGPFVAKNVPVWPNGKWYDATINFSTLGVDFVYVMIKWNTSNDPNFYIGTDEGSAGIRTPGYYSNSGWSPMTDRTASYENLYIRADGAGRFDAGTYEEDHSYFDYNAKWSFVSRAAASGGSVAKAKKNGTVTFDFNGQLLTIYRRIGPTDGPMEVCIDDEACKSINNRASQVSWTEPVAFGPYPTTASHSVTISSPSSTGFFLDGIAVTNLTSEVSTLGNNTYYSENSVGFYSIGNWRSVTKGAAINDGVDQARSNYAGKLFFFTGTQFSFYTKFSGAKEAILVCIDGVCHPVSTSSKHWGLNSGTYWGEDARVTINGLANSQHVVGLYRTLGSQFWFDGVKTGTP